MGEIHSAPSVHGERDLHVPRCGQGKLRAGLECVMMPQICRLLLERWTVIWLWRLSAASRFLLRAATLVWTASDQPWRSYTHCRALMSSVLLYFFTAQTQHGNWTMFGPYLAHGWRLYWFPDSNKPGQSRFNFLHRLAALWISWCNRCTEAFNSLILRINVLPGISEVLPYRVIKSRDTNYQCIHESIVHWPYRLITNPLCFFS